MYPRASIACAIRVALAVQSRGSKDATYAQYRVVTLLCVIPLPPSYLAQALLPNPPSSSCIEHYFALIAACMPTLGPFFKWLRPNHWKHVAIEPKSSGNSQYRGAEAFERGLPRPNKGAWNDTLLESSVEMPEPAAEEGGGGRNGAFAFYAHGDLQPRETERAWIEANAVGGDKGKRNVGLKDGIELQERGSLSS